MPVDHYIGGAEHAVLHLLYSRFWYKFLFDIGVVPNNEPFQKLTNQGLILAEDGQKMSKSLGNVINPDEVIAEHGADALRMYEMFMGPLEAVKPWATQGIVGIKRFLEKAWNLYHKKIEEVPLPKDLNILLHKTIKKVGEDIEKLRFNTAISALMILVNECSRPDYLPKELAKNFLLILAPFAPHITEELWQLITNNLQLTTNNQGASIHESRITNREPRSTIHDSQLSKHSIHTQPWPKYDPALIQEDQINIIVQVNGRVRDKITVAADATEEETKKAALECKNVLLYTDGKNIVKVIYVPKKLVNIVVH
jgi:leucyl-tRNA synthetase